jgi:hypothetical protein
MTYIKKKTYRQRYLFKKTLKYDTLLCDAGVAWRTIV